MVTHFKDFPFAVPKTATVLFFLTCKKLGVKLGVPATTHRYVTGISWLFHHFYVDFFGLFR